MRPTITRFTAALSLLALGCTGTSTGNPFDGGDDTDLVGRGTEDDGAAAGEGAFQNRGCLDEPRVIDLDAATALGFSAADILAFAAGEHAETATWNAPADIAIAPETGEGEVTITVEPGDEVRFVDSVPDRDFALDIVTDCRGRLEIDVRITLTTAGGALDEAFDATLVARSDLLARVSTRLDADALGGALSITPDAPGWTVGQMDLQLDFTPFGSSGALHVFLEMRSEDANSESASIGSTGGGGPLLSWGGAGDCEQGAVAIPLEEEVLGVRPSDLSAAVAEVRSATVTWNDDTSTDAVLGFTTGDHACIQLESYPGEDGARQLSFDATLTIATDDGAIDARWPVIAVAQLLEGGPQRVTLGTDWQHLRSQATPDSPFGFAALDTDGYDDFSLDLELVYALGDTGTTLRGSFALLGFLPPDCDPAIEYDEEGNVIGTGSCPGSEQVELSTGEIAGP